MAEGQPLLHFGVVSTNPATERALGAVCDALQARVGRTIHPRVLKSFGELGARLASGDLDMAWTPPIAAVELELAGRVSIAAGVWRGGGSAYSSALFTRADAQIEKLGHLRGKRIAWVDRGSAAGYVFPKKKLESLGLVPDVLFAAQTFEGTHEAVVNAVLSGRADAGATHVSFEVGSNKIETAGFQRVASEVRVLFTSGPIPPDAIVVTRRLPEELHERITDALLAAGEGSAKADVHTVFAGRAFTIVGSYQYDALRAMLRVKSSGPSSRRA
jgi:phosphate/phosphite/phosphonate ABC transporter binding protein